MASTWDSLILCADGPLYRYSWAILTKSSYRYQFVKAKANNLGDTYDPLTKVFRGRT